VVAVELDGLEELDVAHRTADVDAELGSRPLEPALFHEDPLLLRVDQLDDVGVGAEPPPRAELGDLGVDRLHPALAGDRHAVMTVEDEVGLAELVDDDGREVALRVGPLHLTPARTEVRTARKEVAVEVAAAAVRSDDLFERDRSKSDVTALERTKAPRCFLQWEQRRGRFPSHDACQAPVGASAASPFEGGGDFAHLARKRMRRP
jgi:hypothetical protein